MAEPYSGPDNDFPRHVLTEAESRCWRVKAPDTGVFGFYATWNPGSISIMGDMGVLQIVHYSALRDFKGGIYWLAGSHFDYLMEKCPLAYDQKKYDGEATAEYLCQSADDHLSDLGELKEWNVLRKLVDHLEDDWSDPKTRKNRDAIKSHLAELERDSIFGDEHLFHWDDFYGVFSYTFQHRMQIKALQFWAKALVAEFEKAAPTPTPNSTG